MHIIWKFQRNEIFEVKISIIVPEAVSICMSCIHWRTWALGLESPSSVPGAVWELGLEEKQG